MPQIPDNVRGARFIGWGTSLGHTTVTNDDLSKTMDTNDEWIRERTGIHRRHIGGSTAEMSIASGRAAIEMAGIDPLSIDALVLATTTPDRTVPATSATVQHALGLRCGAFDVNAACSGFVYAMITAHGLIAMGSQRILVIGTDSLSRIVDWTDRNTAILFALNAQQDMDNCSDGTSMPTEVPKRFCIAKSAALFTWTEKKSFVAQFASWLTALKNQWPQLV